MVRTILRNTGSPQQAGAFPASQNIGPRPNVFAAINSIVAPPPSNNNCAAASLAHSGSNAFTTVSATTDGPDEPAGCSFGPSTQIGNDVWFKWLATCTGTATVSLCGSSFDARVAVYFGCPGASGQSLGCNDNFCGSSPQISFECVQSALYRIRIGGTNGATGTGALVLSCVESAPVCPADINDSGTVDIDDLVLVITAWGTCNGCAADVNISGAVDIDDLVTVITGWGNCP
jgi:hypothetical protein